MVESRRAGAEAQPDWPAAVQAQHCPFVERRCYKTRKSQPEIAIGTCTVAYGEAPIMICPLRLLERRQIFVDCLHLLTGHEPGNELQIVSEITVPGGSIDYILASMRGGKHSVSLASRLSTDCDGVAKALGLQSEAKVELEVIQNAIEQRITDRTRFDFHQPPPPLHVDPEE